MADASDTIDLAQLGVAYGKALGEDLKALVGVELKLKGPSIETVDRAAASNDDDPIAYASVQTKDGSDKVFHFLMPRPEAVTLASLLMGQSPERIAEVRKKPIDEETLDAFGEVMNFACAALTRIFTEEHSLPALGVEASREIADPLTDGGWIEDGNYRLMRFRMVIPDHPDGCFDILFPEALAEEWFGSDGGKVRRAQGTGAETPDGAIAERVPKAVVFIDSCEEERDAAEDLEEDLGHPVWGLDPDDFDPDDLDELADADAYVIAWQLRVRPGVAVLEALRGDERTRRVPVIMAASKPTEETVRAALRAGANSFTTKPYTAEEIKARLGPLLEELSDPLI